MIEGTHRVNVHLLAGVRLLGILGFQAFSGFRLFRLLGFVGSRILRH